ncbi:MAG: plastocyanin/azurin family copper-binding protein [Pseudomonadota bacterium]
MSLNRRALLASAAGFALFAGTGLRADGHATHTVEMLNKDPDNPRARNVFKPRILRVKAGDTVLFKSVDRGHNAAAVDEMIPEGTEEWKTKIGADEEVTFAQPGIYGYNCTPHASTGMVGLIIVEGEGMLDNLEDAKGARQRGRAKAVWEEIWEEAEAEGLLEPVSA